VSETPVNSSFLSGIRVLELANELGESCGKLLAGLGCEVIKIEPPYGEETRSYGPFFRGQISPNTSLYFWNYNFGKRSVTLDLDATEGQDLFRELIAGADVVIDARPKDYLARRNLGYDALRDINTGLIITRVSPFGDEGPWAHFSGSDLTHLALGGVMMNCGYDPEPSGFYDTPPIAPQMWQAYHIVGEMATIGTLAALHYKFETGQGQVVSTSVHQAVAQQTETDLPNWIYSRLKHFRATCRHSRPDPTASALAMTKDGRWLLPYRTYLGRAADSVLPRTVEVLRKHGMDENLSNRDLQLAENDPAVSQHIQSVINRFVASYLYEKDVWREFQEVGLTWAPVRRPEENIDDAHWKSRASFTEVYHSEIGESFVEIGARWYSEQVPWRQGPAAPTLGEATEEILSSLTPKSREALNERLEPDTPEESANQRPKSRRGKPFALDGVTFIDLGWMLASAGAGRFLSCHGMEVIRVEHRSRWDTMRWGNGIVPPGGRAERDSLTGVVSSPQVLPSVPDSPNRSGFFLEINSGKRSVSLNLKHPRGKEIFARLIEAADVIAEGFSPGTMDRLGFGYDRLRGINPKIVYVQQSGMGQHGVYGAMRSYGPSAQAFSGISEMSGLPEPFPPAGIGYSYLDWFGAYNMAVAILAGLYRARTTGQGCWIDSSQIETGMYLTGTAILDYTANGRKWERYGNRSPYKEAAPHGVYRTAGDDRWIAIGCFSDNQWAGLRQVLGLSHLEDDARFSRLTDRITHQDILDRIIEERTQQWNGYLLMERLQELAVPAGVCQTAEDRYERDPQLSHLEWLVELKQTEVGSWPVKESPAHLSETPAYMGGLIDRHGPNYAEDNDYVYGQLLGFSGAQIRELEEMDVI
jgi:crotonobetainyl-CoA:carnitine CoA-transferase CaiB-like acyl-CoA transferase